MKLKVCNRYGSGMAIEIGLVCTVNIYVMMRVGGTKGVSRCNLNCVCMQWPSVSFTLIYA